MIAGHEIPWLAYALPTVGFVVAKKTAADPRKRLLGEISFRRKRDRLGVLLPVCDPADIRRIYVRRQPLLETMILVCADKMHFSCQARLISEQSQVMNEGR